MAIEIECPSGLIGKVRGLTGRDGRYLTDRNLAKSGGLVDQILSSCWESTTDPGIYSQDAFDSDGNPKWGKILQGDRYYALLQIRAAGITIDDPTLYDFKAKCKNPDCRKMFNWEIDLDDLPVRKLPESSRERLARGANDFSCVIPGTEDRKRLEPKAEDIELAAERGLVKPRASYEIVPGTGKTVRFTLPTGDLEAQAFRLNRQRKRESKGKANGTHNPIVEAIMMRLIEIEGIDPGPKRSNWLEYLEGLSLSSLRALIHRFDQEDCGIDTTIEIQCPEPDCEEVQEIELPFDENFFFGRQRR